MPKGQWVNRSVYQTYHGFTGVRISGMSDLDRIASHLLATNYSRTASPTAISQSLIQNDCVAVAWYGETLFAASNKRKLAPEDFASLTDYFGPFRHSIVVRGNGTMHAEMQLIEEFSWMGSRSTEIGVSKPCCKKCAQVLDHLKVKYSQYHTASVVNWEPPKFNRW